MTDSLRSKFLTREVQLGNRFLRSKCLCFLVLMLLLCSCSEREQKIIQNQSSGGALGTSYTIIYQSEEELDYQTEIDSVFTVINQSMSTYLPDSDITKINEGDSLLVVDAMFREVFRLSKEIYTTTDGYFDPTVGVLVNAWGFGPGNALAMDSTRVDSLMTYVGFNKVRLTDSNTITKKNPAIRFDFNAIAKGYAIDRLAVLLDAKGIENYLLEVGGEVVAKGMNKIKAKPWSVGVQNPSSESLKAALKLENRAMASSGNYRHFRIDSLSGTKYVHTINPKTGFTLNSRTLGANVLAATCAEADAYATAFMAMDLVLVEAVLRSNTHIDAYIIYLDGDGEIQEFVTDGFRKLLLK